MITGFALMLFGYTLVMLCVDFPWPKSFYPRTMAQLWVMAFGGAFLVFMGSLIMGAAFAAS